MVTKENRVSFITLMTASTSQAGILMALIAWELPYWRYFLGVIYATSLLFLLFTFLLDESLRWLLITGRKKEANDIIAKAAKIDKIDISNTDLDDIEYEKGSNQWDEFDVFKMTVVSRKLVRRFACCVCMWVTVLFNKYTLLINLVELAGNINFALTTFSELPASFAIGFLLKRFKWIPLIFSFLLTGVFCIGQSFQPKEMIEDKKGFIETRTKPNDETNDDDVLEKILSKFRPLGPYYLRLMPFLIFVCISNAFYCMNYVFAVVIVEYRCKYPECGNSTSWSQSALNLTHDTCLKYQLTEDNGTCSVVSTNVSHVDKCQEWVYEDPLSFVADFQLGCQDWKRALIGTVHSFGYMIGLLLLGPISDKIGRKKLIVITGVIGAIMGLARSVIVSYWVYVAFELVEALLGDNYSPNYMLGVEMVAKENRALFAPLMIGAMSVGGMMMALVAWLIPYWRHFLRVIYAPALIFIVYAFFLDESVRWLLIKGRKKEAKNILRKAAKISNVYVEESTLDKIECQKSDASVNLISLLKMTITSKTLLLRFLACACAWITATFNKYGLLINSVSLEGNKYMNYALTSFADLPASMLLVFILIKFKRKKPLIFSFLMTGSFCVIQSFVPKGYPMISTSLFFAGKFMSALSSGTVYLYTTELFPTYTRNTMHALCSSIGRIGSILAPQTTLLIRYWSGFPSLIIGGLSLTTALIVMMLPDTAEDVLPDTIQQAEALGSKRINSKDRTASKSLL